MSIKYFSVIHLAIGKTFVSVDGNVNWHRYTLGLQVAEKDWGFQLPILAINVSWRRYKSKLTAQKWRDYYNYLNKRDKK